MKRFFPWKNIFSFLFYIYMCIYLSICMYIIYILFLYLCIYVWNACVYMHMMYMYMYMYHLYLHLHKQIKWEFIFNAKTKKDKDKLNGEHLSLIFCFNCLKNKILWNHNRPLVTCCWDDNGIWSIIFMSRAFLDKAALGCGNFIIC